MHKRTSAAIVAALLLALPVLAACGGMSTATPAVESPLPTPTPEKTPPQTLRIALLPVLDLLPFHVAERNGYFQQLGIQVEGVSVKSAQEQDALMQAGQIDGMLADLLAPVLLNQKTEQVKAVLTARKVYAGAPLFRILGAPGSSAKTAAGLAGVPIGTAQNTAIEYITDRILEKAGLSDDQIATQEVSALPVRFELLVGGRIPAATLPDPLASAALAAGAVPIADDTSVSDLSLSILAFSTQALESRPDAVRNFLRAWNMAAKELTAQPEKYRDLLLQVGRIPESIRDTFQMPPFPESALPTPEQAADVMKWALTQGLAQQELRYEQIVDASFVP